MTPASSQKEILAELAAEAVCYLEVGVREGNSLQYVVQNASGLRRIVLCDTWGRGSGGTDRGSHAHIEKLLNELDYQGSTKFLDGDSGKTLPRLDEQFDLVHIDGGHSYEVCLADLENGWARCTSVLVAHYASFNGVHRALYAFGRAYAREFVDVQAMFGGHGTMVFRRKKGGMS